MTNAILPPKAFAERTVQRLRGNPAVLGVLAAGSWLAKELDAFSDLDLILVTEEKLSASRARMQAMAESLGPLLSAFTGEHVGEPRLLICLYADPLLHVDLKFLTLEELSPLFEMPQLLLDRDGRVQAALDRARQLPTGADHQWIEDRFWTWVHYALLKIGRGEYMEALDFFGAIRQLALGPLLLERNGHLPRGVRRAEQRLPTADLALLKETVPRYDRTSLLQSLRAVVQLYRRLRGEAVGRQKAAEEAVVQYWNETNPDLPI